jgi:hypothetical protein
VSGFCCPDLLGTQPGEVGNYAEFMGADVASGHVYYRFYETESIAQVSIAGFPTVTNTWTPPLAEVDPDGPYEAFYAYNGAVGTGKVFYIVETWLSGNYTFSIRVLDVASGTHSTVIDDLIWPDTLAYNHVDGRLYFWGSDFWAGDGSGWFLYSIDASVVNGNGDDLSVLLDYATDTPGWNVQGRPQFTDNGQYLWLSYFDSAIVFGTERGVMRMEIANIANKSYFPIGTSTDHQPVPGDGGMYGGILAGDGDGLLYMYWWSRSGTYYTTAWRFDADGNCEFIQTLADPTIDENYNMVDPGAPIDGDVRCPELIWAGNFDGGGGWISSATDAHQDANGHGWFAGRRHLFRYSPCQASVGLRVGMLQIG